MELPISLPLVAIVGRPNVGKSTLFNRIVGKRVAIVDDRPGVTRDSIVEKCSVGRKVFYIADTGGLTGAGRKSEIEAGVEKQIHRSLAGADAVMFVVDSVAGCMPDDAFIAAIVRRTGLPAVLVANKADGEQRENRASEFYELGLGEPLAVSALHGRNVDELLQNIAGMISEAMPQAAERRVNFCIVGRPNVGKSSIVNAILGWDRCVVSAEAGTTRDSVAADFIWSDIPFTIVDTAGQRRRVKKADAVEFYSISRARSSIRRSDVAVLVLDAVEGLLEGDKRIASEIVENKRGFLIAVNKMDLIDTDKTDTFIAYLIRTAPFLRNTPIVFVSALEQQGMDIILDNIAEIHERMNTPLPQELLRNVIYDIRALFSPKAKGRGGSGVIKGVIHDKVNPPRVVIKVDDKNTFNTDYVRMIENRLREVFNLSGVPLDLVIHGTPKEKKKK